MGANGTTFLQSLFGPHHSSFSPGMSDPFAVPVTPAAPTEGDASDGRAVAAESPEAGFTPADPEFYGEGLAALLDAVAAQMPPGDVETMWAFPGVRRDGREHGVAVLTRRGSGDRHLVYRARYVRVEKGQERGRIAVDIEETAEAPAELLPQVIEGVRRRADEAGDAELVDLGPWQRAAGAGNDPA